MAFKTKLLTFYGKRLSRWLLTQHSMNEISPALLFEAGNNSSKLTEWLVPREY